MRDATESPAAPAARCRKFRRGSFMLNLPFTSFDHFVGATEQREWEADAQRLRSLDVDDQLDFRRLDHGQIGRLLAFENPAGVAAALAISLSKTDSVPHEAPSHATLT